MMKITDHIINQARNQGFFRAEEFSWNQDT